MNYYRQCTMTKRGAKGFQTTVAWIPEEFAKMGKPIDLREERV